MLVDTHAHLMDAAFRDDLADVLERAAAARVERIVCVGYDLPSSRMAVALASQYPSLYATVGVHPNYVGAAPSDWLAHVRALATAPRVVGIGETGLDYYRAFTPPSAQRDAFAAHLRLAADLRLPVVVHCREAEADVLDELARRPNPGTPRGVWHCFSGSLGSMRAAVAAGYYISFAGTVTFKNAASLREVARHVPAERLLVETDAPYLTPAPHRGQRNEPARVPVTAACVAEARGAALDEVARQTTANACRLFGLPGEALP